MNMVRIGVFSAANLTAKALATAVAATATCAFADLGDWQVPGNWEVRVSEQGAVKEWTGKT